MNTIRKHNLNLPEVIVSFYRTLALIDIIFQTLSPKLNLLDEMRAFFSELTFKKNVIDESPEKAIQLLVSWHNLIHNLPENLRNAANKSEGKNTKAKITRNVYSSLYRLLSALSWTIAAFFLAALVYINKEFALNAITTFNEELPYLVGNPWFYISLFLTIIVFQWMKRLLSRRI